MATQYSECGEALSKSNLCRRKVLTDHFCPFCETEAETTFHILWLCPSARDVWGAGSVKLQKFVFDGPDFLQVAEGMFDKCDETEFQLFVGIARRRLRRNEVVHGGVFSHPNTVVRQALMAVGYYQTTLAGTIQTDVYAGSIVPRKWQAPPHGWFKVNWDASVDKKNGRVGLGAVVRDHLGTMCAAKILSRQGSLDPTSAEAMAALMAAQLCYDMGLSRIQLEGDAKVVVGAVNSIASNDSCRGHLTEDIRTTLLQFSCWEMGYVRREENKVTRVLARLALNNNMDRVWRYDPPECIREILDADRAICFVFFDMIPMKSLFFFFSELDSVI